MLLYSCLLVCGFVFDVSWLLADCLVWVLLLPFRASLDVLRTSGFGCWLSLLVSGVCW